MSRCDFSLYIIFDDFNFFHSSVWSHFRCVYVVTSGLTSGCLYVTASGFTPSCYVGTSELTSGCVYLVASGFKLGVKPDAAT
jgi:hypothetical protein